ncbi:regulatory protein AfsR [Longispora fulva]|uniref:DNA-binding SARP family transcriptional activator/tetratricopeptide (TPR) repeat protein n=1 Tax=Longispora fulva TaxID=619741 RepID=A0A8J7GMB7_9ACTN|nr:AfsR/SARP family transcriptional regulator [Longispora fulva]MBG6135689.1 DNA-binding SARP family transcriptional activator/tetratricopeptide (TPR) repeat protein [Longispora fulva]GIG56072.1 regulatory protein AfsR [Longispora fulva]
MTDELRFELLGPVRAWRGAIELAVGGPQQRAVLAVLLLRRGRLATVEELVDAVWETDPPSRAVGVLRTYVSRLRTVLGPDTFRPTAGGYLLDVPAGRIDAELFADRLATARRSADPATAAELAHRALALWQGEPLAGVPGPYAAAQRDRLAEERLAAVEYRIEAELLLGRHARLVGELAELTARHPLREGLRASQMLALYRSGRQGEALRAYADTQDLLVEELGADPGPALREVHRQILTGTVPTPRGPEAAAPAQLPADVPDFTGRAAETQQAGRVLAAAGSGPMRLVTVSGPGGAGKTTFALHLAHRTRAEFPDGQLYVDLRGVGHPARETQAVLAGFLAALGVPVDRLPDDPAERAALYRSTVADRRILIVLDNARDAAQVRPLLPGTAGCAVLVTGRARLVELHASHAVHLEALSDRDALDLLGRIVGRDRTAAEPGAAADLVRLCDRLPLAVRIVGARLAARPGWPIATVAARLADERHRLDELRAGDLAVEATILLGYAPLEPDVARAVRLLALPDAGSLSVRAAAVLLGVPEPAAGATLERLVDLSLLCSGAPGRYHYHDLVRVVARKLAADAEPADVRSGALLALLDDQLAAVKNLLRVSVPGSGPLVEQLAPTRSRGPVLADRAAARAWLAAEHSVLLATVSQVAAWPEPPVGPAADVLFGLRDTLDWDHRWAEATHAVRAVAAAAARVGDARAEGRALGLTCTLLQARGLPADAEAELPKARRRALAAGDPLNVAHIGRLAGSLAMSMGRPQQAAALWAEAMAAFEEACDRGCVATVLANRAAALAGLGRFDDALDAGERARAVHRELGSAEGEGHALHNLGWIARRAGRPDHAVEYHRASLAIFRAERYQGRGMGWMLLRLGEAELDAGRPVDATASATESVALLRTLGDRVGLGQALGVLGRALAATGDRAAAVNCWREGHTALALAGSPLAADLAELARPAAGVDAGPAAPLPDRSPGGGPPRGPAELAAAR